MSIVRFIKEGQFPAPFFVQCFMKEDGSTVEIKYKLLRVEGAKAIYEYVNTKRTMEDADWKKDGEAVASETHQQDPEQDSKN